MEGYTEDDLRAAGLSPEEMAAMNEEAQPEGAPAPEPAPEGVPPVVPPTTPEGEGGAPAQVAAPEVPPATVPGEGEAAPMPPEGGEPPVPAEAPPVEDDKAPVVEKAAPLPSDPFAAMFTGPTVTQEAYDAALADLKKQAQDGTIDMFDYADKVADLKADFKAAQAVAQFAQQANTATAGQKWQYAQDVFKSVHPEYQNPAMWGALDGMVRQLSQDAEAQKLSDIGFLSLAHEKVQEALGLNKPKAEAAAPVAPAEPQAPERKPALERDKDKIPPSLGGLPAAQSSQPEDEFADLDRLEGMDYEAAVANMERSDPAKYQRWLRG